MKITSNEGCAFLTGLAIGIGAALLLAPKPGAETIATIKHKAKEGVDSVKQQFDCATSTAKQTVERGKQAIRQQTETLTAAVQAGKRAYREAAHPAPQVN